MVDGVNFTVVPVITHFAFHACGYESVQILFIYVLIEQQLQQQHRHHHHHLWDLYVELCNHIELCDGDKGTHCSRLLIH